MYVEKPLGNFIGEQIVAIEAAKKYDRIVQIGTQQHSREHYRKAVEIIQSGRLGDDLGGEGVGLRATGSPAAARRPTAIRPRNWTGISTSARRR